MRMITHVCEPLFLIDDADENDFYGDNENDEGGDDNDHDYDHENHDH